MKKTGFLVFCVVCSIVSVYINGQIVQTQDRDSWQEPERIMNAIGVKAGMVIGEVGAGSGYFTLKLAERVGETGKVYANDINEKALRYIKDSCKKAGLSNVFPILGYVEDPLFPQGELDLVFMAYVYHHLDDSIEFLRKIKSALKPQATLAILEQDPEKLKLEKSREHSTPKAVVIAQAEKAGFELIRIETVLNRDNIFVFRHKKTSMQQLLFLYPISISLSSKLIFGFRASSFLSK